MNYNIFTANLTKARQLEAQALEMLPYELKNYIKALPQCENISLDFAFKPILHTLGGLAQGKLTLVIANWKSNTATLTFVIGPPTSNKNAIRLLRHLQPFKDLEKRVEKMRIPTSKGKDGKATTMQAGLIITKGSSEAIQALATANLPFGVLWICDELLHMVTLMTDPRSEKGQHLIEILKVGFEAGKLADYKKTVNSDVGKTLMTFIGSLQPDLWNKFLLHIRTMDTGLMARIVYIIGEPMPPKKVSKIPETVIHPMEIWLEKYLIYLAGSEAETEVFAANESMFIGFNFHLQKLADQTSIPQIAEYITKQSYYLTKYALMHHVLHQRNPEEKIQQDSLIFSIKCVQSNIIRFMHAFAGDNELFRQQIRKADMEFIERHQEGLKSFGVSVLHLVKITNIPKTTLYDYLNKKKSK